MTDLDTREQYDALIDDLAADARERADGAPVSEASGGSSGSEQGERTDGAPTQDDCWDSVSAFVPELTAPVCDRVLELSDREPLADLVEHVTDARGSDEAEYRRAQAVTVLLQDVEANLARSDERSQN